jgi:ubiquinone/menaquinone biosynthesis C-methylase UbiE
MVSMESPQFRSDLYRDTAEYYDRFRPNYPDELIDALAARTGADGTGTLLDLACGTGQVSFALRARFASIWAVDQEPDMVRVASAKADAGGDANLFQFVTCAAEELAAPEQAFDLITIGNAFHRLPREAVARSVLRWLKPGGYLALLWAGPPNYGNAPWQQALQDQMQRWQLRPGAEQRVPTGYDADRAARPDQDILRATGFEMIGRQEFSVSHVWTATEIAGYVASTSVLSPTALGPDAEAFDVSLRQALFEQEPSGQFRQDMIFAYDLARRPV